jgi:glycosyltransferase involved in cell wall biosynthesis
MNNRPLLSIAIPTKNRQYYCIEVIKHILAYKNNDFELVIQDNSDDKTVEDFISKLDDSRLKYVYTNEAISSVENMSRSIALTSGEYVCMIGDDDIVLPTIFEYAAYMKTNNIDSICPGYIPEYFWPNEEINNTGTLKIIRKIFMKEHEQINPINRLEKLFKNGIINYQMYKLPRVYHGLIKKETLNKIYNKIGAYFGGLSPDIYSTVALSSLVEKHVLINNAISIAGVCPQSTTSQSRLGGHKGELKMAPHLKNNVDYRWNDLIPAFYSVETIWAETAVTAAIDFEVKNLIPLFDIDKFYLYALYANRDIKKIIYRESPKLNSFNFLQSYLHYLIHLLKKVFVRVFLEKTKTCNNISHISDCVSVL